MSQITNDWLTGIEGEFSKPYYKELYLFLKEEYSKYAVYPPSGDIFSALNTTPLSGVKVVILGQDPYHEPGQAHGMAFSVKPGVKTPPSLENIYKELRDELGCFIPDNGYLMSWAKQGVLLLNTLLTVRAHSAFSHKGKGWEQFTDACIKAVALKEEPVVYMLWGSAARAKRELILEAGGKREKHLILEAPHPSPLSAHRGFFGCGHFKKCNEFLVSNGLSEIDWQIQNLQ